MKYFISIIFAVLFTVFIMPVEKVTVEDQQVEVSNAFDLQVEQPVLQTEQDIKFVFCERCSFDELFNLVKDNSPGLIDKENFNDNATQKFSYKNYNRKDFLVTKQTCKYDLKNQFLVEHYKGTVLYPIRV